MKPGAAVTPIALLVLAAGAGAYVTLVDRSTVSDADRAARRRDVFPSFRVDEVKRISLEHGSETLVLEREGDGGTPWTMTSPRREHADPGAVEALLRELETSARVRDVQQGDARGLDNPRVRGTIRLATLEYRFAMGDDAPRPDGSAYLRLEDEGTFVVSRALKVQLLRDADAYRERALLSYGASEIARLEIAGPGGFMLERSGAAFRLAGGLRASRAAVDHLLAALADTRAESFIDDAAADRALGPSATTLTVTPRDPSSRPAVTLRLGGQCPTGQEGVVAARTAPTRTSACVARTLVDAIAEAPATLTDTSPFFAHADEMEELKLERVGADGRIDVARRGTIWRERAPEDRDLSTEESDSANALAAALATARAIEARRAGDEAFPARVRATVVRTGGSVTEVVELGPVQPDGTTPLRRLDDGAVLRLPAEAARRFAPQKVALRAPAVWRPAFDTGAVTGIESTCGPAPERLELHEGRWSLLAPGGLAADPVAVVDLAGAIAHARADAWIAEADDGTFGFAAPGACQVTLTMAASDGGAGRRDGLVFGAETTGGYFAHALSDPAVFVAASVLRTVAGHPAIDRRRLRFDPSSLASLTLLHGGERTIVATDAGEGDPLARAVAALYAQVALHAGPAPRAEGMDHPALEILATARPDAGVADAHVLIGASTTVDGADGYFARAAGVDATFFVPRQVVDAVLALL